MKLIVLLSFALTFANAGNIIYNNMYSKHTLIQGSGKTQSEAENDASSMMPEGFIADLKNSSELECVDEKPTIIDHTVTCKGLYRVTIPIIKDTPMALKITKAEVFDYKTNIEAQSTYNCSKITLNPKPITDQDAKNKTLSMTLLGWNCKKNNSMKVYTFTSPDIRKNVFEFIAKDKKNTWIVKFNNIEIKIKF